MGREHGLLILRFCPRFIFHTTYKPNYGPMLRTQETARGSYQGLIVGGFEIRLVRFGFSASRLGFVMLFWCSTSRVVGLLFVFLLWEFRVRALIDFEVSEL